jgi:hypothetical protein
VTQELNQHGYRIIYAIHDELRGESVTSLDLAGFLGGATESKSIGAWRFSQQPPENQETMHQKQTKAPNAPPSGCGRGVLSFNDYVLSVSHLVLAILS